MLGSTTTPSRLGSKGELRKKPLSASNNQEMLIFALANGLACSLATYEAHEIYDYTFYTEAIDKDSVFQNLGLTMEAFTGVVKNRYYGRIENIWDLDLSEEYKMVMFRIRQAKSFVTEDRYFPCV